VTASTLRGEIANAACGDGNPALSEASEHLLRWVGADWKGEDAALAAKTGIESV